MKIYELQSLKIINLLLILSSVMEEGKEEEAFLAQIQNIVYGKGTLIDLIVQILEY